MATILLIDDAQFCRELVSKALRQEGYHVVTATDGRDGLAALKRNAVHLIVLDNEMPVMDGPAFLQKLRENPIWARLPVVMLTGNAEKEKVLVAKQFGAAEYILKAEFSLGKLLERVRKRLPGGFETDAVSGNEKDRTTPAAPVPTSAPQPRQILSIRDQVIGAIDAIDDARTLGGVVARVLAIATSPRAGLRELAQVVQQDPVLSARTLRLANSAAFATQRPSVTTLEDAIRQVGAGSIRALAMSLGVFESLSSGCTLNLGLLRCWGHAIGVAALMDRMSAGNAEWAGQCESGVAHLAGLCHDLGEILLRQRFPDAFVEAEQKGVSSGASVLRVLPDVFGISYDEVTERLLGKLCMPAVISQPIVEHARREGGKTKSVVTPISRMLSLADCYANGLLLASSVTATLSPILLSENPDAVSIESEGLTQEVLATLCAMAKLSPAEELELLRPLIQRQPVSVVYVRDRTFSTLDPIETALKAICEVKTVNHYPAQKEQAGERPIVVVAIPRLDAFPHSNLGACDAGSHRLSEMSLFIVGHAVPAELPRNSGAVYHRYPISLHVLNGFLERSRAQASAA